MILIADLVPPAAEAAPRVDAHILQLGQEFCQYAFALEGRGRVAVVEAAVVGRHDLVGGAEHFGVNEAADAVAEEVGGVDGFEGRFGHFEHDGPVRAFLGGGVFGFGAVGELEGGEFFGGGGLVVGGVVGEDGGAVEGAVFVGEVELVVEVSESVRGAREWEWLRTQHLSPILSGRSPRTPTPMTCVDE